MILTRRRLLARLGAVEPRLVRLCAPPGYGKTEFAALWARRYDRHATCSCSAIAGAADFAGRLMSALARESHGSSEGLARTRLFLHVTEADDAAWSRSLLEAWKLRQERALLILENADAVAAQPSVLALLGDLLAARPAERVLLLSSRRPLPIDAGRYLAPHQVLTLTSAELQLENDDAANIFEGTDLGQSTVDRIVSLAGGWPIALLLLARIAHYEPNLERLLDRLSGTETDLHEYVLNEILSAVTPDMMSTMLAAAAIPRATLEDISVATGIAHAAPVIEGLLRLPGFIIFQAGTYQIHPLIHSALRTRHEGEFAAYVVRAAVGNEGLGDFLRAAELFNAAGDGEAAASALDRLPPATLAQATPRMIDALTKIPVSAIVAHPNLWIATLPYRRHVVDVARLHEEAAALQQAVTPDASPALHRRLGVRRAMLACGRNRLSEAQAALEALGEGGAAGETPEEQRLVLMASAVVAAKRGRFSEADELIEQSDAVHEARHLSFDDERAQIAMEKAAAHGEWDGLLKIAEERLSVALQTGSTERIVDAAQTVARAAWYRDDDDRVGAAQQIVKDSGIAMADAIEMVAIRDLQAGLSTSNVERAAALLDRAIDRVDASEDDFLRIVVRICAALLAPAQRRRLLEARAIAEPIESHPLQTSIELLIDSAEPADHGMFKNLAARVARSPLRARDDRLFVDVLGGRVRRGSDVLRVSDRGLELLAALALFEAGTAHELAAALWPALDRKAAVNALKMCVSRTRAQIGDRESIQNARNGYALGDRVESDVRELQRLLHSVRGAGTLGESLRQQLHQALSTWRDRKPGYAADWKWFGPYAARLAEIRRELELALEWDAARREGARDREAIPR